MGTIRRSLTLGVAAVGVGAAVLAGAGTASAITVAPLPNGTNVELSPGETAVLANVRVAGPVLNAVYPGIRGADGRGFGDYTQVSIDRGAAVGSGMGVDMYGPLNDPHDVVFYHYH